MQEWKRVFTEARALKAFVVATMVFCVGLLSLENMDKEARIYWLILTALLYAASIAYWRRSNPKRRKHRDEVNPTRRNPPAKLPPLRD
jgi:hypothetical protein